MCKHMKQRRINMQSKQQIHPILILVAVLTIAAAVTITLTRPRTGLQQPVSDSDPLRARLAQLGIPVKDVQVKKQSPLEIEIILQSSSPSKQASQDDLWYKHVAAREAQLAYLTGLRVSSYRLTLVNAGGETISSEQVFLNPDLPSQQLSPVSAPAIGDEATKNVLATSLNTFGMRVLSLSVTSNHIVRANTKLVELRLSTPTAETANQSINQLVPTLGQFLKQVNREKGAQIAVSRLRVTDADGKLLIEYILDFDTGAESWSVAKGVDAQWFPQPRPIGPMQSPLKTP